jgi:hypothetical protein
MNIISEAFNTFKRIITKLVQSPKHFRLIESIDHKHQAQGEEGIDTDDKSEIVASILSAIFSSPELYVPMYCDKVKSANHAAELMDVLPLIYIWNQNVENGSFALSINGSIVGRFVEKFMSRSHVDFKNVRDEIMETLSRSSINTVSSFCEGTGDLPSVLFSGSSRKEMVAGLK